MSWKAPTTYFDCRVGGLAYKKKNKDKKKCQVS